MKNRARELRRNATDAERLLWRRLRHRQICGCKFRRQKIIGPYIVDLVCVESKLVVEVDGGQHSERLSQDMQRSQYLESVGYRVLRFWNNDVLADVDSVLQVIYAALCE